MKKKLLTCVLIAITILTLAACGSNDSSSANREISNAPESTVQSSTPDSQPATSDSQPTTLESQPATPESQPSSPSSASTSEAASQPTGNDSLNSKADSQPVDDASSYATLEDWINSDECTAAVEATNAALANSGVTCNLAADGNIFIYEYTLLNGDFSALTTENLEAAFGPVIEQNRASMNTMFASFDTEYGIRLDGARFVFYAPDGSELFSGEIANE